MDANQTKFHLLLGRSDWQYKPAPLTAWDDNTSELTLAPVPFRFPTAAKNRAPSFDDRRGAAADRYGNWYSIGDTRREIVVQSEGTGATTHFWSTTDVPPLRNPMAGSFAAVSEPPQTPSELAGLAVTSHHYLVAGLIAPAGLAVFDLHHGGPPNVLRWPDSTPFVPFDFSPAPNGGLFVLDRVNARVWLLDAAFRPVAAGPETITTEAFQPIDATLPKRRHTLPQPPLGTALPFHPIAIEAMPGGDALLLLEPDRVTWWRFNKPPLAVTLPLKAHDFALSGNKLYVANGADGDQCASFDVVATGDVFTLTQRSEYLPMRLFGGKAIATAPDDGRVFYDSRQRWVPLVEQRMPRYQTNATVETRIFDGKEPNCVWHRLLLDACIPAESDVEVETRAGDDSTQLSSQPWNSEPPLYRRGDGSEIPFLSPANPTWELLLQRAQGRYLQLRLTLSGNGRTTPRLRALRIYYQRFSYLINYLPGVYRQDRDSASFLDRFLANFEGIFTSIEDRIAMAQVLFDVRSAPVDTLDWLSSWFGAVLDLTWDEPTRRLFLSHVMDFYQYRGTVRGVTIALRLALEGCPDESIFTGTARPGGIRIIENFLTRRSPALATPSSRWIPSQGAAALNARFQAAYPVVPPTPPAAWQQFSLSTLGFVPRSSAADAGFWAAFLHRRYGTIAALNTAYASTFASFADVPQAATLPDADAPLKDWFEFQGLVLPTQDAAHRFTVMLPVPEAELSDLNLQRRRLELARRLLDLEKPAHTLYDVRFFWAFFRLGEARLQQDTILDQGSRATRLLPPMTLGQEFIGSSYLAAHPPQDAADRFVLGRDPLSASKEHAT